jgi:hypothetical protein
VVMLISPVVLESFGMQGVPCDTITNCGLPA